MDTPLSARARSTLAYVALAAGVVGAGRVSAAIGAPAAIGAILLAWPSLKRVPRLLIVLVCATVVATLAAKPGVLAPAGQTLNRLAALIIAVMLLAHVLGRSRHLGVISEHLFAGRALTRYLSVTFGSLFLAVPLNFGAVSVIGTLVGREIETHGDSPGARNAARAVLRGFGSASLCSPLSIAVVLTLSLVPGLHGWQLIGLTFPLAAGYLGLGAVFRETEPRTPSAADRNPGGNVLVSWLFFAACIGLICLATFLLRTLLGFDYARAVTCSCLAIVLLGLAGAPRGERLPRLDNIGNELAIIGGSAFLGAALSAVVSTQLGANFALAGWMFPAIALGVPWLLFAGGLCGLNPLILVTLIGGLSAQLWPPAAGLGLAVALVSGWGLTIAGTPYSANALLVQRLTGYDNWRVTVRWSGGLSLCALSAASLTAATLTVLLL